jgi:large subunit ribosomal protein L19
MIHEIEKGQLKPDVPIFSVGDTVDVECIIQEGAKERRQIFSGVVIAIKGRGLRRTFTVRRIVQGEGVERVFPVHAPMVADIRVKKRGVVRRAKLYYLQKRSGKSARIKERIQSSRQSAPGGSRKEVES